MKKSFKELEEDLDNYLEDQIKDAEVIDEEKPDISEEKMILEILDDPQQVKDLVKKCAEKIVGKEFEFKKYREGDKRVPQKVIGTVMEKLYQKELIKPPLYIKPGSSKEGIDIPTINTDVKATKADNPQATAAIKDQFSKIFGLGYNLMVFLYNLDKDTKKLKIVRNEYIDKTVSADIKMLNKIKLIKDELLEEELGEIFPYLEEDEIRQLTNRIRDEDFKNIINAVLKYTGDARWAIKFPNF